LILLNQPKEAEQQLNQLLQFIDDDIKNKKGSLWNVSNLGGILTRIVEVRMKLPDGEKHYMDAFRDQIKARINELNN
jgi:hypothetical protein